MGEGGLSGHQGRGTLTIRPADLDDAAAIADIYNQGVASRNATFEADPREPGAFADDFGHDALPFLVSEREEKIAGWARLSVYSTRPCYRGVLEASVYVDFSAHRRGVGRSLLAALLREAERAQCWKVIALIFPENEASTQLFHAAGFEDVGLHRRHGLLDGVWRDVLVMERPTGYSPPMEREGGESPADG